MAGVTGRPGAGRWGGLVRAAVPADPIVRRFAVVALIDAVGTGLWISASALFLTRVVGVTLQQVGLGISLAGLLGLLSAVPIGAFADRVGAKRALTYLVLWRAAGFVGYAFTRSFLVFLVVAGLLGLADKVIWAVTQALISDTVPEAKWVRTIAYVRAVRNAGFAIGALVATVALLSAGTTTYVVLVLANALSFALVVPVIATFPTGRATGERARVKVSTPRLAVLRDRRYLVLTGLNGALMMHITLLTIGIPLWLVTATEAPVALVAPLIVVNTVGAVLFQVRVSARATSVPRGARCLRTAGVALGCCCVLLAALVALTYAELVQSAGSWAISLGLADEENRGVYLSTFSLGETAQTILGPVLVTALIGYAGGLGWLLLGAALTGIGALVPLIARPPPALPATPERTEPDIARRVT